ncbi:hypothetical protein H5410_045910, partial [Solanum commersonii]
GYHACKLIKGKASCILLMKSTCEKKISYMENTVPIYGREIENVINSVLHALPIYMMSLFPIPTSAIKSLDRMRRKFMRQGYNEKKRFHLVE